LLKLLSHGEKGFTLIELLVVIVILGVVAAIVVPNVAQFMGKGEEEARQAEHHNLQTAVLALLADAEVHRLDDNYFDVRERTAVEAVTAGTAPNNHSLDEYLIGGQYPLKQAYDIWRNGSVTVHPS
jgi:type IV pilus assembly protein PilA